MMDNWKLIKIKGEKFFKEKDYQKACDHYNEALTDIESKFDESKPELKVEAAKITSNISLMYLKLSKERNDDSLLHESQTYAKTTINYNPKWIKGYLRLADVCEQTKDLDDILNAITVYLHDNKGAVLNDDFQLLLKKIKYYTHKTIMLSHSWHLVKYKDNVYVIDPLGAGHFKDLQEFINCHGKYVKNVSLLVRPGVYVGTYEFIDANIDIVGDCSIEINPTTKAIDKDPSVIFINTLIKEPTDVAITPNILRTFLFKDSVVSLKRIYVDNGEMTNQSNAIVCLTTALNLLECCFISKFGIGLYCSENSKLYCKSCRSVGGLDVLFLAEKSHAKLTACFISEINGIGIQARDDAEMISLKHCTIIKCKKHGLLVFSGAKMAKIIDCYFEGNCSPCTTSMASIQFTGCRGLIKNTSVKSQNYVGIAIDGGSGNFDNVIIENSEVGMIIQAPVEIKNCIINSCSTVGILIEKILKGTVFLENNSINKCLHEIARTDDTAMPTFIGEKKNTVRTLPTMYAERGNSFKEQRKARIRGSRETNNKLDSDDFYGYNRKACGYCILNELNAQRFGKTLKVCEQCKMVFYCSPECQQKGWKLHKVDCENYVKANLAFKENTKT